MPDDSPALELIRQAASAAERAATGVAALNEKVDAVAAKAQANHELLHGNGKEGLKERMSHVERSINELGKKADTHVAERRSASGNRWAFAREVVTTILAAAGAIGVALIGSGVLP